MTCYRSYSGIPYLQNKFQYHLGSVLDEDLLYPHLQALEQLNGMPLMIGQPL